MAQQVSAEKSPLNWRFEEPALSDAACQLLEQYARIPSDQVNDHVKKIREEAFKVFPYPCIGNFRFLDLSLVSSKVHDEVVDRVRNGAKYLDVGCCFGQEVRYLVSKGCQDTNLYGADLRADFIDFGYELFRDKETLNATFLAPFDIFSPGPSIKLDGKIDIVHAASFFHLFSWKNSITIGERIVKFLKPAKGSLVVGRQMGSQAEPGPKDDFDNTLGYRHNANSWREMWTEIGKLTDSEWDVDFWWDETRRPNNFDVFAERQMWRFYYIVRRR